MEGDSCEKVLGMEHLLGEILKRTGCTRSFVCSGVVSKFWRSMCQTPGVVHGFNSRKKRVFLGFVAEFQQGHDREMQLLFAPQIPSNVDVHAMRMNFSPGALDGLYLVGSHGGRLISQEGVFQGLFSMNCPYSRPEAHTSLGLPIDPIPRNTGQHTANTYGQFALLYRSGPAANTCGGFFVKDAAGFFDRRYEGVRFNSDSDVYVHVCVLEESGWVRSTSGPFSPPPLATFHRNPYCVEAGSLFYLMYLVGFIVTFNAEEKSFGVVHLPGEMATTVKSWFEYTAGPHPEGDLALVSGCLFARKIQWTGTSRALLIWLLHLVVLLVIHI